MNEWKVTYYKNIRTLFNQLNQQLQNTTNLTTTFSENKDTCTLCLDVIYKDNSLKFYYIYGSTQGVGVSNDDYFKIPTKIDALQLKIINQIEYYTKKWQKEEKECA